MSDENEAKNIAEIMCSLSRVPTTVEPEEEPVKVATKRKARKHERKKRLHEIIPFPLNAPQGFYTIPNSEVINSYPPLLFDILGGGDAEQFRKWLASVSHPDIEMVMEFAGEQNPFGPNNRQFLGLNHVTEFFLVNLKSAPDVTFESFEPVRTRKDEITGEYFQTWTVLMEMHRIKQVVDTVSAIEQRLVDMKQAKMARKEARKSKSDLTTAEGSDINNTIIATGNNNSTTSSSDTSLNSAPTAPANTASNTQADATMNNLTQKLASFSLAPIEPERIIKQYHASQMILNYNADQKITRICTLFNILTERPTKKVNGVWY